MARADGVLLADTGNRRLRPVAAEVHERIVNVSAPTPTTRPEPPTLELQRLTLTPTTAESFQFAGVLYCQLTNIPTARVLFAARWRTAGVKCSQTDDASAGVGLPTYLYPTPAPRRSRRPSLWRIYTRMWRPMRW